MLPGTLSPAQASACLRALKTVAMASGGIHPNERALLEAAATTLRYEGPLDGLPYIEAGEAAAAFPDARARTRLLESMMLMALMDQDVDAKELAVIDDFAETLGVDEPSVKSLHQLVDGQLTRMKVDVMRRSYFAKVVLKQAWAERGLVGVWKAFAPRIGLGADPDLAWKYKELGLLPEGTLGRAYWAHCTSRHLDMPGEAHGFLWQVVHDMGHVLGEHDTDPGGEIEQAAFEAGYMHQDPFFLIFATTMMFHLGVNVLGDDYIGNAKGKFDPHLALRAYERGCAVTTDLTKWDYWPHVARPIAEVRRELNIAPRAPG